MMSFLIGALLGAPWVLSFAPKGLWWLGLGLLSVLPFLLQKLKRPCLAGLGFGWAAYGVGVSWLHISLHDYGGLPSALAWAAVLAFSFYLALFPFLAVWIYQRFSVPGYSTSSTSQAWFNALLWAATWTFTEWARGTFLTGFAWLGLGDALVDSPFAGLLPWLGSHGSLFLLMCVSFLMVSSIAHLFADKRLSTALSAALLLSATVALARAPVETRSAGVLPVVGVQTNVDQSIKFDPDLIVSNMQKAFALGDEASRQLAAGQGGLLVFPETVNPLVWTDTPVEWQTRFR
ncbi:MAG TPA: hypothetical protein VFV28_07025, partial [Limnobacter sp.]|nr:hypothetical protein [Limnobacter sp.]